MIWPGILADNLLDLKAYIPEPEIQAHFPELIAANTVNDRLVALPANLNEGMLFYRVDLLRKYGYRAPPKTWEELEVMARRIQAGERANGNKDFWGFIWEGAPSEALTCNALEWQVSEGGGTILDENGKVTVNNPQTIRAWDRATHWVGSISPPGVVLYKEWDAGNMWQAGKAAFLRSWASEYIADRGPTCLIRDSFDIAPLPGGQGWPQLSEDLVSGFRDIRCIHVRQQCSCAICPAARSRSQDAGIRLTRQPYLSSITTRSS